MLKFDKFTGLDNVQPAHRLTQFQVGSALTAATDLDVGLSGELKRRTGYVETLATCHKNLHQADGFLLATVDGGDLTKLDSAGGSRVTLYPSLGSARVWYCNLPDGRTTFSNGSICGITDGVTATGWGVPIPASLGALTDVVGLLDPGDYQYMLTYVRTSDKLEGGPLYSNPLPVASGGIVLTSLPTLAGYSMNVYITAADGDDGFYAGNTTSSAFSYTGKNDALALPCRTGYLQPAPAGTVTAFWRGRVLIAQGNALYASRTNQWEAFDFRRDFKQFSAPITLIQPVDGGVFVGTSDELAFLAGAEFDKLTYRRVVEGSVVLGSGVSVRGELVKQAEGSGLGSAMICIANGVIVAGFSDGGVVRMTEGRYKTTVTEVSATFRQINGIPQYIAVPQ